MARRAVGASFPDDFTIHDVVAGPEGGPLDDCDACEGFHDALHAWGAREGEPDREIVLSARTNALDPDTGERLPVDLLPVNATEHDEMLDDIATLCHRFCRCFDYFASGNEAFAGNGVFVFDEGGGVFTPIHLLDAADVPAATADVLEWLAEQRQAALVGSALGGRPLRLFGPALVRSTILNGSYDGSGGGYGDPDGTLTGANRSAYFLREIMEGVNVETNTYTDVHVYYEAPADRDGYDSLLDGFLGASAPWDEPNFVAALECAPKTSFDWYNQNKNDLAEYRLTSDLTLPPGLPNLYNTYVEDFWRDVPADSDFGFDADENGTGDFDFNGCVLDLQNRGFAAVLYGVTFQFGDETDLEHGAREFDCSAMVASKMKADWFEAGNTDQKTVMMTNVFIPVAEDYDWTPFDVHDAACCTEAIACPGCN